MNILICDDNNLICEEIHALALEFFSKNNFSMPNFYIFNDGKTLLSSGILPDIVFLDIQMPGMGGIEIGNLLHSQYPNSIIFVITSFWDYLDDAMRFNVFRYITKPIDKNRLFRNMKDAVEQYNNKHSSISVKCGNDTKIINTQDIIMVEASLKKTIIYFIDSKVETSCSFSEIKKELNCTYFYQCHRSFIINFNYVSSHNSHDILLINDLHAHISPKNYSLFKEHYIAYINSCVQI